MLTIYPALYELLEELLIEAIDGKEYYSNSIWFDFEEVEYRFLATLMIRYRREQCPDGDISLIANITPVWWEFHSTTREGEVINDFDFNILKKRICS